MSSGSGSKRKAWSGMRSGPTPAVVLEQTRMVMLSGLRSPPATGGLLPLNRKRDGESETRRAAGRRPFTPSPAASGAAVDGGHDPRSGDCPLFHPVIAQRTGAKRAPTAAVSTRKDDVFPTGWDTTDAEKPVAESKNNRGDCSPVPRRNRVGTAETGERRTLRRPACNLGASRSGSASGQNPSRHGFR